MKERMQRFMYGRYGMDDLGRFMNIVVLVVFVLDRKSTRLNSSH